MSKESTMRKYTFLCMIIFLAHSNLLANEHAPLKAQEPEMFSQLKTLIGSWEGTTEMNGEKHSGKLTYELTSAGTAIVEKLFAGTPHEMTTVYTDDGTVTHYCAMGNAPELKLTKKTDQAISFELDGKKGIGSKKENHMHALTITWKDQDTIVQDWVSYNKGKYADTATFTWNRVQK